MHRRHAAFTLVELSIVLVILGLLVGGVMTGAALMKAAKLRSVTTEASNFQTAIDTFYNKYGSLPGDMPNAMKFWGAAAGDPNSIGVDGTCDAVTTAATGSETCNGDGNGLIGDPSVQEVYRGWQHLANAGLISGTYAGVAIGSNEAKPGYNVPASAKAPGGWQIMGFGNSVGNSNLFDANYGNALEFGSVRSGWTHLFGANLRPDEAQSIDAKIDDGKAGSGRILTPHNAMTPNCLRGDVDYDLGYEDIACILIFISPTRGVKHE